MVVQQYYLQIVIRYRHTYLQVIASIQRLHRDAILYQKMYLRSPLATITANVVPEATVP